MANQPSSGSERARVVLEGVPRVGFGVQPALELTRLERGEPGERDGDDGARRCPEDVPFPACLRACLEFVGESYGHKPIAEHGSTWRLDGLYTHIMGTSGSAFRLNWKPGWHGDNAGIFTMSDDPAAPFRRAFEAVGYGYEIIHEEKGRDNAAYFRRRIIENLGDNVRPVLAHGVIGPPEACIIAGYDECGDVLIGWSFFQDFPESNAGVEFEPSGYFRKRDWFKDTWSLIVIGEQRAAPPLGQIYRESLEWALTVARTPATYQDRYNGLAAYGAWADALSRDGEFPAGELAVLRQRHMVHDDAVSTVAEGRWYGAQFLKQVAEHEPAMAAELLAAAACYEAEHDLMWQVWNLVGGLGRSDAHARRLAEPTVRRQMAPLILQARAQDEEAGDHIERALVL